MKQQTAVEWLMTSIPTIIDHVPTEIMAEFVIKFSKAKQMEKEQIKEAYNYGWDDRHHDVKKSWLEDADENYYNETYGQ
jgi:hypothetical protein